MIEPLPILMENAIQIAWDYLERTEERFSATRMAVDYLKLYHRLIRASQTSIVEDALVPAVVSTGSVNGVS
jgi:hypothetical protein